MSKNLQLSGDVIQHHLSPFVDLKTSLALLQTSKQFSSVSESLLYKKVLSLWDLHREKVDALEIKSTATPRRSLGITLGMLGPDPPTHEEFRKMGPPAHAFRIWKEYLDLLLLYQYNFLFKYYIDVQEWFLSDEIGEMSAEQDNVMAQILQLESSLLPVAIQYLPLRYIPNLFEEWYRNISEILPPHHEELPELSDEQFIILVLFLWRVVRELSDKEILESWKTVRETHFSDLSDEKVPLHDRIKKIYSMVIYHDSEEADSQDVLALAVIMANRSNLVRKYANVEMVQSVLSKARDDLEREQKIVPMLISDDLMYELDLIYSLVKYPLPRRTLNILAGYLDEPEKHYPRLYPSRSR